MTRIAVVEKDKCHPDKCGNYLCIRVCPVNLAGTDCIVKSDDGKVSIYAETCTGCGICPRKCPFDAITIINLPDEITDNCVHQYDDANGFKLYRAPVPLEKKVVGLLGPNGTGKTTALKILSGDLAPNLGAETAATHEELQKFFAGTEMLSYIRGMDTRKISYKPQHVEQIPKAFKGKVKELLAKADDQNRLTEIVKELGMHSLEQDVSKLSGGELQKVAIAATLLKDADLYFFDELSSYLDIKERLRVARVIQKLAETKHVMIVEHDLVVLDYLTDTLHIVYGKPAAYGIISHPMAARAGINAYLEGYLKDENMRIRDKPLKFTVKRVSESKKKIPLVKFDALTKKYKSFALAIEPGMIHEREIVGVIGANATGKTTFMKLLAGVEKPTTGELSKTIKIAYKPQYLETSDETVQTTLGMAPKKLLKDLSILGLEEKKLEDLSGGELQRVAIAKCLLQKADLYLLDEPSAHLDVNQRVKVADVIRREIENAEKSAMIIDHDLMLLDYVSDRTMVFSGKPGTSGTGAGPFEMQEGMNAFLKELGITFRRDPDSGRPRANKEDSVKDREQKEKGVYYYVR